MVTIEESEKIVQKLYRGELRIIKGFEHPIEKVDIEKLSLIISGFFK